MGVAAMTTTSDSVRSAGVAPFAAFAVGVLLVIAAMTVLGLTVTWVNVLLVVLLTVSLMWLGWRASWRPRAVVGGLLLLVVLGSVAGFAFSAAFPSMGPLVAFREDRVLADVRGLAADGGFTALVVPGGQSAVDEWPVGELTDPAGFTLAYGQLSWGHGSIAEYRATGPMTRTDLRSLIKPGQPIAPGWNQMIPAGAVYQDLTVQGGPAVGLDLTDDTGQPASVLVAVIGDVVVRAWLLGDDGMASLVATTESLVPLP